jgi:hypothetical protein
MSEIAAVVLEDEDGETVHQMKIIRVISTERGLVIYVR